MLREGGSTGPTGTPSRSLLQKSKWPQEQAADTRAWQGEKVEGALGPQSKQGYMPGDKQGDVDTPVPALGRAPRREEAWPPQGAQEAQGLTVAAFSVKLAGHELPGAGKAGLQPQHKRAKEEPPLGHPQGFLGLSLALPSRP